jgi:hypothetical protein
MKRISAVLAAWLLLALACNFNLTPGPTAAPSSAPQTVAVPTAQAATPQAEGTQVVHENVSFFLSKQLALSSLATTVPAMTEAGGSAPWDIAPQHIEFELQDYLIGLKPFHQPRILVYPAEEYAAAHQGAATAMAHVRVLLDGSAPITADNAPSIPFFNAAQQFVAQGRVIQFQSGSGVRMVTQYAQYAAPINNTDLFYQFQGLSSDGRYYIIAILPTTAPMLAQNDQPDASVPPDGVPFPGFDDPQAGISYDAAITARLDAAGPETFGPSLALLDALIESISISPQP